jgi:CHAD domain-containing protein
MLLKTDRVQKSIGRLRKFLKKNAKHPEPEKIHDVRTSARRLEASLETMDVGKKKLKKRLRRDVSALRKRLGKVRDMDVLTDYAMSISPEDSERECLVELLEYLGTKRAKHTKRLRKTSQTVGPNLRSDLQKFAEKMDEEASDRNGNAAQGVESDGKPNMTLESLLADLHRPAHLTRSNLHPYRLKVKELRYVLQFSEDKRFQKFIDGLGEVKDAIGEWHDWEELVAIAGEVVDQGSRSKLVGQLKKIADEKLQHALGAANRLRKAMGNRRQEISSR